MGHHVRFDEDLLRDIAAKNEMTVTDEQIAELVENGGYEIMGATEAGITDDKRAELMRLTDQLAAEANEDQECP